MYIPGNSFLNDTSASAKDVCEESDMVLPSDICDVCIEGGKAASVDDLVTHSFIIFNASFQYGVYEKQTTHYWGQILSCCPKYYSILGPEGSKCPLTLTGTDRDPTNAHCQCRNQ